MTVGGKSGSNAFVNSRLNLVYYQDPSYTLVLLSDLADGMSIAQKTSSMVPMEANVVHARHRLVLCPLVDYLWRMS